MTFWDSFWDWAGHANPLVLTAMVWGFAAIWGIGVYLFFKIPRVKQWADKKDIESGYKEKKKKKRENNINLADGSILDVIEEDDD